MKSVIPLIAVLAISLVPEIPHAQAAPHERGHATRVLLTFSTMYGVDGPFVGDANPVRGLPGDDLPWEIRAARGVLLSNGFISIAVRGLVFPDDPSVPPDLRGINDEAEFRAVVSCLAEDGSNVTTVNVASQGFPATSTGDAFIFAHVQLPNPCVAPIVFIVSGDEDDWLAITGVETD